MSNSITTSISELIAIGGPVVAVLLLASVFLLALIFLKLWQFFRMGLLSKQTARIQQAMLEHWQRHDFKAAQQLSPEPARGAMSLLLASANTLLRQHQLAGNDLIEELRRVALGILAKLRAHLRTMEVIANLAPLIGMLGTVLGMIKAFQAMQLAGKQVDPAVLSGGIWEALLTTAVGLIVAIPATLAYNWFDRRVETCAEAMQDTIAQVSTLQAMHITTHSRDADAKITKIHSTSA